MASALPAATLSRISRTWTASLLSTDGAGTSLTGPGNSVARSGGQFFEPIPHPTAALAITSPRFAARWFELVFIINAFGFAALASPAGGRFPIPEKVLLGGGAKTSGCGVGAARQASAVAHGDGIAAGLLHGELSLQTWAS